MKLLFMTLVVLSSYSVRADVSPERISPQAITEFKKTFSEATNVEWTELSGMFRVKFSYNEETLYAFYNEQGERICMGRNIAIDQLPSILHVEFERKFSEYKILDAFEISTDGGICYYVTVTDSHKKLTLKSIGSTDWTVYRKTKIK